MERKKKGGHEWREKRERGRAAENFWLRLNGDKTLAPVSRREEKRREEKRRGRGSGGKSQQDDFVRNDFVRRPIVAEYRGNGGAGKQSTSVRKREREKEREREGTQSKKRRGQSNDRTYESFVLDTWATRFQDKSMTVPLWDLDSRDYVRWISVKSMNQVLWSVLPHGETFVEHVGRSVKVWKLRFPDPFFLFSLSTNKAEGFVRI